MDVAFVLARPAFSSRRVALTTPRTLVLATLLVASTGLAPRAHAEGAPSAGRQDRAATLAERARLQGQLDRVNAEIDAIKRRPRGIRDDYRLRSRMADAEALARQLTELDARLGPPPSAPDVAPPEIRVNASDDRAEREAKADILADQARRLAAEATLLEGRLTTLRARNELKRRSGQLERDPFAPLEQVKSRVGVSVNGAASPSDNPTKGVTPGRTSTGTSGLPTTDGSAAGGSTNGSGMGTQPGGAALPPTATPQTTATMPLPADSGNGSLAGQLRGVLDPTSLEEVRRLETPGAGPANVQVMERALATLRTRAAQLTAASTALRTPRGAAP